MNSSHAKLKDWDVVLTDVYVKGECDFAFRLKPKEDESVLKYGAPKNMWIVTKVSNTNSGNKGIFVDFEVC